MTHVTSKQNKIDLFVVLFSQERIDKEIDKEPNC